ncbi:general secretion pathway protein I [Oceanithermus profundus DSM 14977]|uniref:General secretion pathway protein I n=1 Tax=Oceanithermus profundus (strain DSM 14977 / NBRC 100410 / VKM B-2274 / 506) TaxID=670487 RepID=E4U6Y3_OCEP5|nr:type II secretion system protein [Oceanithermus profundus]ADR35986.1 general secretion pathway protein I [Oceanithermus profundus DSM 14977]
MRRRRGFTLVEVTVALVVLALGGAAVTAALLGVERSAREAQRLGAQLAALENAAEAVRRLPAPPSQERPCPGLRAADYPELGAFRCVVRPLPGGGRAVEVVLLDGAGRVLAATVGVTR